MADEGCAQAHHRPRDHRELKRSETARQRHLRHVAALRTQQWHRAQNQRDAQRKPEEEVAEFGNHKSCLVCLRPCAYCFFAIDGGMFPPCFACFNASAASGGM